MKTNLQVGKHELLVSLHPATVIHADRYSETTGGYGHWPVRSSLYTEVVFRSKETGMDWPITITDLRPRIYTDQQVTVIAANSVIVGFVDTQTQRFYYTVSDFARSLGLGTRRYLSMLAGIVASVACFLLLPEEWKALCVFAFVAAVVFHYSQKAILNRRIEKAIDQYLTGE